MISQIPVECKNCGRLFLQRHYKETEFCKRRCWDDFRKADEETRKRKRRESAIKYARQNPEKIREAQRKYVEKNKDRIKLRRIRDKEKNKICDHQYYLDNRASIIKKTRAYRIANPDVYRRAQIRFKNKDVSRWRVRETIRAMRKRALRKFAATDKFVEAIISEWRKEPSFICYYCSKKHNVSNLHVDHIVPLSKGGGHTSSNICRSCSKCNLGKQFKLVSELSIPQGILSI